MNKYICIDTELGGIGREVSLLTAFFAILDENFNITDELYLRCRPDNGIYNVTGQAMKINGIDLSKHDEEAKSYKECGTLLYQFLQKNKQDNILIPIGHNVRFDIQKLTDNIISTNSFFNFVSYRTLDTGTIGGFAIQLGLIPNNVTASLNSLAEYFKVGRQKEFGHDAKDDVMLTIEVYKSLYYLFSNNIIVDK